MKRRTSLSICASVCAALLLFGCGGPQESSDNPGSDSPGEDGLTPAPAIPATDIQEPAPPTPEPAPPTPESAPPTPESAPPTPESAPPTPEPVPPTPESAPAPAPQAPTLTSGLLDLRRWKLTLPIETPHAGRPDEILQPELQTFVLEPYFRLTTKRDGVVFRAPVEGATTSGSGYPRSELREMTANGKGLANWSTTSGKHTMIIRQAITHLPTVKDEVVAGQIHDGSSDLIEIRLEGRHLFVAADGPNVGTLDPNYTLGTVFTVKIEAANGHVKVYYNGVLKVDIVRPTGNCYFKAGMYTQSNLSKGDPRGSYGEAIIYDLKVTHE